MEVLLQLYLVKVPVKVLPTGIDKSDFVSKNLGRKKARDLIIKRHPELKDKKSYSLPDVLAWKKTSNF